MAKANLWDQVDRFFRAASQGEKFARQVMGAGSGPVHGGAAIPVYISPLLFGRIVALSHLASESTGRSVTVQDLLEKLVELAE